MASLPDQYGVLPAEVLAYQSMNTQSANHFSSDQTAPIKLNLNEQVNEEMIDLPGLVTSLHKTIRDLQIKNNTLQQELDKAKKDAYTSPETGLPNKLAFNDEVKNRIKENKEFAIALIDITNFKSVNDRYGHKTGDDVLDGTGKVLQTSLKLTQHTREEDYVVHLSGDEFAIIFCMEPRESDALTPNERVEAIRQNLIKNMDNYAGLCLAPELNVSAAIGIAVHNTGDTAEQTFERADALMYLHKDEQHKQNGTSPRWVKTKILVYH